MIPLLPVRVEAIEGESAVRGRRRFVVYASMHPSPKASLAASRL
jgi:hypothetical protein